MPPQSKKPATGQAGAEQPARATPTVEQAAQRRAAALDDVKQADRGMVDALLAERRGYVQRGMDDRVAEVDEQLKLRGYRTA